MWAFKYKQVLQRQMSFFSRYCLTWLVQLEWLAQNKNCFGFCFAKTIKNILSIIFLFWNMLLFLVLLSIYHIWEIMWPVILMSDFQLRQHRFVNDIIYLHKSIFNLIVFVRHFFFFFWMTLFSFLSSSSIQYNSNGFKQPLSKSFLK